MDFWTAITVIAIVALSLQCGLRIVKMASRYYENIARIQRGYPTIDGSTPLDSEAAAPVESSGHRLQ